MVQDTDPTDQWDQEAALLAIETIKRLRTTEMVDMSIVASNVKHIICLCVLAAGCKDGMREATAKRLKRWCLRLGKASERIVKCVRQGIELDDEFEKLVCALDGWHKSLAKAHQEIRLYPPLY